MTSPLFVVMSPHTQPCKYIAQGRKCHRGCPQHRHVVQSAPSCRYVDAGRLCFYGCSKNRILCHRFQRKTCQHGENCNKGLHPEKAEKKDNLEVTPKELSRTIRHSHDDRVDSMGSCSDCSGSIGENERSCPAPGHTASEDVAAACTLAQVTQKFKLEMFRQWHAQTSNRKRLELAEKWFEYFDPYEWEISMPTFAPMARDLTTWLTWQKECNWK